MINSIKNGDQPLPRVTQVSNAGTSSTEQPPLKEKSMCSDQEKRIQKIDRLARSLLIQGLPNDIYSLIYSNKTAKDLWDALARHILGSEYSEQDRKAAVLYKYETFKATEGELLLDTYIRYLQVINDLKKFSYSKDNCFFVSLLLKNLLFVLAFPVASILVQLLSQEYEAAFNNMDSGSQGYEAAYTNFNSMFEQANINFGGQSQHPLPTTPFTFSQFNLGQSSQQTYSTWDSSSWDPVNLADP
nr:hypothetical protein [Tanacetum cinerariifolium]